MALAALLLIPAGAFALGMALIAVGDRRRTAARSQHTVGW